MGKAAKIAISLPKALLDSIERERAESGESRSEYLRHAVEAYLRQRIEREQIERYIEGYRKYPETEEELAVGDALARDVFLANPWDEDADQ